MTNKAYIKPLDGITRVYGPQWPHVGQNTKQIMKWRILLEIKARGGYRGGRIKTIGPQRAYRALWASRAPCGPQDQSQEFESPAKAHGGYQGGRNKNNAAQGPLEGLHRFYLPFLPLEGYRILYPQWTPCRP